MKVTVGDTDGKTHQIEVEDASQLLGTKVGETFDGGIVGLSGYKLEITGGSDREGFPMRRSIGGSGRRRVLLNEGAGIQSEDNERRRKSVRGNTVSDEIEQLNTKVVEEGSKSVDELLNEEEEE